MTRVVEGEKKQSMVGSQGNRKRRIRYREYRWVSLGDTLLRKEAKKEGGRWNESWFQRVAFLMTSREENLMIKKIEVTITNAFE